MNKIRLSFTYEYLTFYIHTEQEIPQFSYKCVAEAFSLFNTMYRKMLPRYTS